jgi:murein DD-endopeptidase MepM/ murein hydrolase activator NlpD
MSRAQAMRVLYCAASMLLAPCVLSNTPARASTLWPVENGRVVAEFAGRHRGIDIAAPAGTAVRAFAGGVVAARDTSRHCGEHLSIRHADGSSTLYCNLADITVALGDAVKTGSSLGRIAAAPEGRKSHLHFELKLGDEKVDPLEHLPRTTE